MLVAATMVVVAAAALSFWRELRLFPHGQFDAWAIWNLRALAIGRDPWHWTAAFDPMVQHADYPPLLPLSVARLWFLIGDETTWAPRVLSMAFTLSAAAAVAGAVGRWAGWQRACLALIALVGWLSYGEWSASQYADGPIGAYMVTSLAWLGLAASSPGAGGVRSCRVGAWVLAGLLAGMTVATKNEGWVWALGSAMAALVLAGGGFRNRGRVTAGAWCVGAVVPVSAVMALWIALPRGNDLVLGRSLSQLIGLIGEPQRHVVIVRHFWLMVTAPQCWVLLLLPVLWLIAGPTSDRVRRRAAGAGAVTVMVAGAGYYLAYLITPHDLVWHLGTSMVRLAMQLWPSVVVVAFVSMQGLEPAERGTLAGDATPAPSGASDPSN